VILPVKGEHGVPPLVMALYRHPAWRAVVLILKRFFSLRKRKISSKVMYLILKDLLCTEHVGSERG
jgi:hypothetical protein